MSSLDDINERRAKEAARIRLALNKQRGIARLSIKGGDGVVAFVKEEFLKEFPAKLYSTKKYYDNYLHPTCKKKKLSEITKILA